MFKIPIRRHLASFALAALLLAPVANADPRVQVVDSDGTLLTLVSGSYGDLFPGGFEANEDAQVLALDVAFDSRAADDGLAPDGPMRLLVPTTASSWPESSATLLYDAGAGVTFLLWSAPFNGLHPMLYLTTFDGSGWGEVLEIVGTIFAPKMDLQLAVGHDSHQLADGTPIERTVVHVAWWEPRATGTEKQYAALVLENGAYVGRTPSRNLSTFLNADASGPILDESGLAESLVLQPGPHETIIAGYHDTRTGQLSSLQVEVLPLALSILADRVETAAAAWDPSSDVDLMTVIDDELADSGDAFHPAVLSLLSGEIFDMIAEAEGTDGDLRALTDKFGPRIIHIGMRVGSNGLVSPDAVGLLTISPEVAEFASPRHDLKVTSLGRWDAPEGVGASPSFLLSRDGGDALVAWAEEKALLYRETEADGSWSEVRSLDISERLTLDAAMSALAAHIRDR